jgi:hypothetical protein
MRNTADVIGGKSIVVLLQSILDVSAINPLLAFYDIQEGRRKEERERCCSFILSGSPHEIYVCMYSFSQRFVNKDRTKK